MKTEKEIFDIFLSLLAKKVTIFKYGDMGFAHCIQCEVMNVYRKDYAQYYNCIHIDYKPKSKKNAYVWRIHGYEVFAVYLGHIELNTAMYVKSRTDEEGTRVSESLMSFSEGYLDIALASTSETPLIIQRHEEIV